MEILLSQKFLLLTHFAAAVYMTGVIWIVQLVHYPLMALADPNRYELFQQKHMFQISFVVMPGMLIEIGTMCALFALYPKDIGSDSRFIAAAVALGVIWLSTFLIQTPIHSQLVSGYSAEGIARLVQTNWIRTLLWSVRSLLVGLIVYQLMVANRAG